jgi:hypothetical protein
MGGVVFLPPLQIICHFAEVTIMRKSIVITRLLSELCCDWEKKKDLI